MKRKILVTSGLPYANGPIHLGHMVEYLQTDIWARWQRLLGHDCIYLCGDDAHGTPIMISAQKQGITPEALIAETQQSHETDFADFHIKFDSYYTTHSEENRELAELIYQRLCDNGDIEKRTIEQAYDPEKNMFLPDRFVKGTCPHCGAKDQYGDSCEVCGSTYSPTDLIDPISVVSGATPVQKQSEHFFFKLDKYSYMLETWMQGGHLQPEVAHKLQEWFTAGLKAWDITRDAPYFGFEIPNAPGKYFYVWLDAPIGYMAALKKLAQQNSKIDFASYWDSDSKTEVYHFVGKDIIYFHALFWPAILTGAKFRTPNAIYAHGFLTVNGHKMSKSRGTFILARDYLQQLNPEYLRYYFAAKLNSRVEDLDLNFDDFEQRANSDLVGKVVNIASRCARFINKQFNNRLSNTIDSPELLELFVSKGDEISKLFTEREYSHGIREIMALADKANQYIDEKKPWVAIKDPAQQNDAHNICSMGLNLFRILMLYLKPVLPDMATHVEKFLNISELNWNDLEKPLVNHVINEFQPLIQRVDRKKLELLIQHGS